MSDEYNEEFQNTNENNIENIDNENTRIKLKESIRKNEKEVDNSGENDSINDIE